MTIGKRFRLIYRDGDVLCFVLGSGDMNVFNCKILKNCIFVYFVLCILQYDNCVLVKEINIV